MATLVIAAFGSWGDVFPAFGLATALRDRGHTVRIAATANYEEFAESEGLGFIRCGPPWAPGDVNDIRVIDGRLAGLIGIRYILREHVIPFIDADVDRLVDAAADADALIAHPLMFAAPIAAEVLNLPTATFSLFPELIPSDFTQPVRFPVPSRGAIGRLFSHNGWVMTRRMFDVLAAKPINAARKRVGLVPVPNPWFWPLDSGQPFLVLASPAVVARPADWPHNVELTGYVGWDRSSTEALPDELEEFLRCGAPPVLVTLGTSSAMKPGQFFNDASAALERVGRRALFLTGPAPTDLVPGNSPSQLVAEFTPLSSVAPRCAAAVHHGGAGTAAAFLEAGIPQLIVPGIYGQPHTAHRLRELGLAEVLPWRRVTRSRLATSLERLLSDASYADAATRVADQLANECGATLAAERVEGLLGPNSNVT